MNFLNFVTVYRKAVVLDFMSQLFKMELLYFAAFVYFYEKKVADSSFVYIFSFSVVFIGFYSCQKDKKW